MSIIFYSNLAVLSQAAFVNLPLAAFLVYVLLKVYLECVKCFSEGDLHFNVEKNQILLE